MARYSMAFSKTGYMIYISHLDLMRLFRRTFTRAGIPLQYSQGYNPHPKMSFAQPLSLGYEGMEEYLEFYLTEEIDPEEIQRVMGPATPEGIDILSCQRLPDKGDSLSASCVAALYEIRIPLEELGDKAEKMADPSGFLAQDSIKVFKKVKKKKDKKEVEIRDKIRELDLDIIDNNLVMSTKLDAGSASNLSAELLLEAFLRFHETEVPRETVEISRLKLLFND